MAEEKEVKVKKERKVGKKVGSFFSDFKKFISKGNILDLAVGVAMGTAFNAIVNALVKSVIMPFISFISGGKSVAELKWVLKTITDPETGEIVSETAIAYGVFIQAIIDFLIIAMTLFIVLRVVVNSQRGIKKLSRKEKKELEAQGTPAEEIPAPAPVKIESQEDILKDIRTLLQGKPLPSDEEEVVEVVEEKVEKTEEKKETKKETK